MTQQTQQIFINKENTNNINIAKIAISLDIIISLSDVLFIQKLLINLYVLELLSKF